jgi:dissimilatory sulfite reductase (desulfoviridin) alpha/beta subunit
MGDAIFRQRSGVLGVGIAAPCGIITPEQLVGLGRLAQEVGCLGLKLTTRQTMVILIPEERLGRLRSGIKDLGLRVGVFGEVVRNVKACAGSPSFCLRAAADICSLGTRLQERFMDQPVPNDFKISLAGCSRGCTDPYCADYGVIATGEDAFEVYLGGRGGSPRPVHGRLFASGVTAEGVEALLEFVLETYRRIGQPKERLCRTLARVGWESFRPPESLLQKRGAGSGEDDFAAFLRAGS